MPAKAPSKVPVALKRLLLFCGACAVLLSATSCGRSAPEAEKPVPVIRIACLRSAEAIGITHLATAVLEDKLGYDVKLDMLDPPDAFRSLAAGRDDVLLDAWLPVTDAAYMKRYRNKLVDLGTVCIQARIGLVVPDYAPGKTIGDLRRYRKEYGGRIVGIQAGTGMMVMTRTAIRKYGLRYRLVPASASDTVKALESAIRNHRPVVVTGWRPHWTFGRWTLRFLEDPGNVYGPGEAIHAVARSGFADAMPKAAAFLRRFRLDGAQADDLLLAVHADPEQPLAVARTWMREHPQLVDGWIGQQPAPKAD